MTEVILTNASYYHPSYLLLVIKAFEIYAPGKLPHYNATSVLRPGFRDIYETQLNGSKSICDLDKAWHLENTSVPTGTRSHQLNIRTMDFIPHFESVLDFADAFVDVFADQLRMHDSLSRRQMTTAFETHSDVRIGWEPRAISQTQLCTGDNDNQVPHRFHTSQRSVGGMCADCVVGIATMMQSECSRIGLLNLTASLGKVHSAAYPSARISSIKYIKYFSHTSTTTATELISWARLKVAALAVAAATSHAYFVATYPSDCVDAPVQVRVWHVSCYSSHIYCWQWHQLRFCYRRTYRSYRCTEHADLGG